MVDTTIDTMVGTMVDHNSRLQWLKSSPVKSIKNAQNVLFHTWYEFTTVYMSYTPGAVFEARLLYNLEGAITERLITSSETSRRDFSNADLSLVRTQFTCGDIEHGKSADGGVIL